MTEQSMAQWQDAGPGGTGLRIVLGVATFRRTDLLRDLVPVLVGEARTLHPPARVVIVDNDPDASARALVAEWDAELVEYHHEPNPGIAAARNRILDASATSDAVVFLDDDETPEPGWLARMVVAWQRWGCEAVAGPRVSHLPDSADEWVRRSGTFDRTRLDSGTVRAGAATNNLLLDVRALHRLDLRFDERFGLSGGEDTMLTRSLTRRGGTIRWLDEAEVHEPVPADRATREWVLRRRLRTGNGWARVHLALAGSRAARLRVGADLGAHALVLLVRGAVVAALWRLQGRPAHGARAEVDVASAVGVLQGLRGFRVTEYARE